MPARRFRTATPGVYRRGYRYCVAWRDDMGQQHWRSFASYEEACRFRMATRGEGISERRLTELRRQEELAGSMPILAERLRIVVEARTAKDADALRAALLELASAAVAWADRLTSPFPASSEGRKEEAA